LEDKNMASTTFSGPIKAGTIPNTTGTTLGSDVKNVGQVVMCQSQAVTQADGTTNIVIPANSQIVAIEVSVDVVWDGVASTLGVGWTGNATALTAAAAVAGGTLGIISATAGADATRVNNWADVGTTDRRILITSTNTGAGEGFVTVRYVQNNNLS
jgi:hypothetical protein